MALIQAMEEACDQIEAASIQVCDVDEALWPDPAGQRDV